MWEDSCPNCGHRRKRQVMSTDPDAPSPWQMFYHGEGEFWQVVMSRFGFMILMPLILAEILHLLHITL